MINDLKKIMGLKSIIKILFIAKVLTFFVNPSIQNTAIAGLEFQWDNNSEYRRLKWFQKSNRKKAKNTIYLFLRPSDRKTGFIKLNIKIPDNFKSSVKEEKISLCQAKIGGYQARTKCINNIPADIEFNKEKSSLDIFPLNPLPSSKDTYAVVFKVNNPMRAGLYQFHTFGQSSGQIPVSYYLGSYTLKIIGP